MLTVAFSDAFLIVHLEISREADCGILPGLLSDGVSSQESPGVSVEISSENLWKK